jgi:hypothetical protein
VNADVDVLLGKASREQLMPVYTEVKGLVCCMVPDIFATMWTGLTFAGGAGWCSWHQVTVTVELAWLLWCGRGCSSCQRPLCYLLAS